MNVHRHDFSQRAPDAHPEPSDDDALPSNIQAEQALLGAILINNDALARVRFLEPDHFSEAVHRDIYAAIIRKVDAGKVANPILLKSDLPMGDMVGSKTMFEYIVSMVSSAPTVVNARDYGLAVLEAHARRAGIRACWDAEDRFRDASLLVTEVVGSLEDEAAEIRALAPHQDIRTSIGAYIDGFLQRLGDREKTGSAVIPHPLPEIGTVLQEDGWEPGNLYGLVAASGEGKTSLTLQILRAAAEAGHPVLLMSYDQTGEQVSAQMVSQAAGIALGAMRRRGGMNDHEWKLVSAERDRIVKLPVEVIALRQEKIGKIGSMARGFAKNWSRRTDKAPLIILDHNRKVTPDRPNDHEGRIAAAINGYGKALAREIGAAVLFLNQRNSSGGRRDVPRPIVGDLFGGEQAREDYDAILYLYRPEHWKAEKLKVAGDQKERDRIAQRFLVNGEDPEGKAEIGALKVRYGRSDVREILKWTGRFTRYESMRQAPKELPF